MIKINCQEGVFPTLSLSATTTKSQQTNKSWFIVSRFLLRSASICWKVNKTRDSQKHQSQHVVNNGSHNKMITGSLPDDPLLPVYLRRIIGESTINGNFKSTLVSRHLIQWQTHDHWAPTTNTNHARIIDKSKHTWGFYGINKQRRILASGNTKRCTIRYFRLFAVQCNENGWVKEYIKFMFCRKMWIIK